GTTFAWFTDSVTSGVNKIVAGNLDIEVQYTKNGTDWADLKNAADLFQAGLWEPGHTEYVTLKIENKGTLALNYKMLVTPVTEKGGVNVNGDSFKLSDYLVLGTTDPVTTAPEVYNRDTARAAVGTTVGLNTLTENNSINAGDAAQYITLVVYMPETVGNEANYKTGTQAPEIELGIQFVATQKIAESDSFGTDYDANATGAYVFNPSYDYYPQVVVSAAKAESGATTLVKTQDSIQYAKATVPEGAVAAGVSTLTLKVTPKAPAASTTEQTGLAAEINSETRETANFDVKVEGVKTDNTAVIAVEIYVGTGLQNVKVYHNGNAITSTYNASTGIVSFSTTSFSDYTVAYDIDNWANHAATVADDNITINNAAELAGFAKNVNDGKKYADKTVTLGADINLAGYLWKPIIGFAGTFNGNNHTISNMTVVDNVSDYAGFFATLGGTVKNVTFDKASVTGNRAAIVAEYTKVSSVVIDNVKVLNCVVDGEQKNGGLIGFASGAQNGGCTNVTITNCLVDGLTFKNDNTKERAWQSGALIGYVSPLQNLNITGNTVKNVTMEFDPATECPTVAQYASHPLIGAICVSSAKYDCSTYTLTIKNNTYENCTGFANGDHAMAYCGGLDNPVTAKQASIVTD
ncbi:MAG: hypothetical protein Q3985_06085, partial [Eubacteriales bacterium]|nr:hypothetical protein [Eubacteriales bacterium]